MATAEPVVFEAAMEALFLRTFGDKVTPAVKAELKAIGVDLDKLQVAYDVAVWSKAVDLACRTFFPGASADEAHYQLGQAYIGGLEKTFAGKALFALGRVLGPLKMMDRMTRNFRSSNNYLESTVAKTGEGMFDLISTVPAEMLPRFGSTPPINPHYLRGILRAAVSTSGAKNVEVQLIEADVGQRRFRYSVIMKG